MPSSPQPPVTALRLGTRNSPLAMAQAEEARDRLIAAHPGLAIEIVPVTASGDKIQDRPLAEIGGKALWTKELDQWLLDGEIDFAVHSSKDVETLRPAQIAIAAILPREDVRDVLVGAASVAPVSNPRRCSIVSSPRKPSCRTGHPVAVAPSGQSPRAFKRRRGRGAAPGPWP